MTFILPNKTRILWQLRIAVAFFIAFLIILIVLPLNVLCVTLATITLLSAIFLIFVYIPVFVKNYKIVVNSKNIYIFKGVIIKSTTILPQVRLIFVQNLSTPLMSVLKLEIIMFKVAKGWIFVPEIDKIAAQKLLSLINGESK